MCSELKRRLKAEQKAKEKAEKAEALKAAASNANNVASNDNDEETMDPNVSTLSCVQGKGGVFENVC